MKVEGPRPSGKLGPSKKTSKSSGSGGPGFSSALHAAEDSDQGTDENAPIAGGAALGSIDALLALQGVDAVGSADADGKRRNGAAARRGDDLLDRLEQIRIGLLSGTLSVQELERMQRALEARSEPAANPELRSVLQDIELRVAVELAKYSTQR